MNDFLLYVFYPNPGQMTYGSPTAIALFALTGGLIVLSFLLRFWRARLHSASTKKLTRAWPSLSFWFGLVGLVLVISRIEKIQFVAMRFMWVLWALALLLAAFVQFKLFRMRHYEVLPRAVTPDDPRARYLPGKKR
jgi:uncharacterized membrane protein YdcZ (DUF606 family)